MFNNFTNEKKYVLGIDLGTYNSSAALLILDPNMEKSEPIMIGSKQEGVESYEKQKAFPSFVSYNHDGSVDKIGLAAKERLIIDPQYVVWGTKRLLGKTYDEALYQGETARFSYTIEPDSETGKCIIVVGEKRYRPEDVCGEIIKKIKEEAEKKIGVSLSEVIISIPAYFDAIHVTPIVQVAKIAGFESIKTIPEPVAASIAYELPVSPRPRHVIVFDLGAGTLDVTAGVLTRKGHNLSDITFVCKKITGSTHLGGIDMDDRVARFLREKTGLTTEISTMDDINLRREAEKAKIRLSKEPKTSVAFEINGKPYSCDIDRLKLEGSLRGRPEDLIGECKQQVLKAIKGAGWTPEDVEQILFVGGPSSMPCILEMLKGVFSSNPAVRNQIEQIESGKFPVDPMEVVAKGAALSSEARTIIPHPYGYGFLNAESNPKEIIYKPQILIPRDSEPGYIGAPYWIQWFQRAATTEISIIQQAPETESDEYSLLGSVGIAIKDPGASAGAIEIGMNLSENEELIINLRCTNSGEEANFRGIGHLKRTPIKLPYSIPKGREEIDPREPDKLELDENALIDLINWAQTVYKLYNAKIGDLDLNNNKDIRLLGDKLQQTFYFHVWDDNGNIDLKKSKEKWSEILNNSNQLLHRAAALRIINDKEFKELQKKRVDIRNRLFNFSS